MNKNIFDATKLIAYFLWEYTNFDNALFLWNCAEDITNYFRSNSIFHIEDAEKIINSNRSSINYINFMRHIAFRIFIHTNNPNDKFNWFVAEKLIFNYECLLAILKVAANS